MTEEKNEVSTEEVCSKENLDKVLDLDANEIRNQLKEVGYELNPEISDEDVVKIVQAGVGELRKDPEKAKKLLSMSDEELDSVLGGSGWNTLKGIPGKVWGEIKETTGNIGDGEFKRAFSEHTATAVTGTALAAGAAAGSIYGTAKLGGWIIRKVKNRKKGGSK